MYRNIGENLKFLRETRIPQYSQREVSRKLKINRNTYAKYEQSKLIPPLWFLYDVAKFYGIDFTDLIWRNFRKEEEIENISQRIEKKD